MLTFHDNAACPHCGKDLGSSHDVLGRFNGTQLPFESEAAVARGLKHKEPKLSIRAVCALRSGRGQEVVARLFGRYAA